MSTCFLCGCDALPPGSNEEDKATTVFLLRVILKISEGEVNADQVCEEDGDRIWATCESCAGLINLSRRIYIQLVAASKRFHASQQELVEILKITHGTRLRKRRRGAVEDLRFKCGEIVKARDWRKPDYVIPPVDSFTSRPGGPEPSEHAAGAGKAVDKETTANNVKREMELKGRREIHIDVVVKDEIDGELDQETEMDLDHLQEEMNNSDGHESTEDPNPHGKESGSESAECRRPLPAVKLKTTDSKIETRVPVPLPPPEVKALKKDPLTNKYHCPYPSCDNSVARLFNMTIHYRTKHLGEKGIYKCSQPGCTYTAISRQNFIVHLDKHDGKPRYKCSDCPAAFFGYATLFNHRQSEHEGGNRERPFICELCQKGFTNKHNLSCHKVRVHRRRPKSGQ